LVVAYDIDKVEEFLNALEELPVKNPDRSSDR